jgi:hypothetical protein
MPILLHALTQSVVDARLRSDYRSSDSLVLNSAGSGFGVKNGKVYYDNFESRPTGVISNLVGEIHWEDANNTIIDTVTKHSGTKALSHNFDNTLWPHANLRFPPTEKIYFSCYLRFEGLAPAGAVWKMARIGANTLYTGVPHVGASYTSTTNENFPNIHGGEIVTGSGVGTITSSAQDMVGTTTTPSAAFIPGQWLRYEVIFNAGTLNGNDSLFEERVDGEIVTRWANRPYLTSGNSDLPTWLLLPINGLDRGPPITFVLDEIYFTNSLARVLLTDNISIAASTKRAVVRDKQWSNERIILGRSTIAGLFNNGENAVAHVYNDSGALAEVIQLTI